MQTRKGEPPNSLGDERFVHFFSFCGDGRSAEFVDGSLASGFSELCAQCFVRHQSINFCCHVAREFVRVYRFERGLLHLLQGYEETRFTIDNDLFDSSDG